MAQTVLGPDQDHAPLENTPAELPRLDLREFYRPIAQSRAVARIIAEQTGLIALNYPELGVPCLNLTESEGWSFVAKSETGEFGHLSIPRKTKAWEYGSLTSDLISCEGIPTAIRERLKTNSLEDVGYFITTLGQAIFNASHPVKNSGVDLDTLAEDRALGLEYFHLGSVLVNGDYLHPKKRPPIVELPALDQYQKELLLSKIAKPGAKNFIPSVYRYLEMTSMPNGISHIRDITDKPHRVFLESVLGPKGILLLQAQLIDKADRLETNREFHLAKEVLFAAGRISPYSDHASYEKHGLESPIKDTLAVMDVSRRVAAIDYRNGLIPYGDSLLALQEIINSNSSAPEAFLLFSDALITGRLWPEFYELVLYSFRLPNLSAARIPERILAHAYSMISPEEMVKLPPEYKQALLFGKRVEMMERKISGEDVSNLEIFDLALQQATANQELGENTNSLLAMGDTIQYLDLERVARGTEEVLTPRQKSQFLNIIARSETWRKEDFEMTLTYIESLPALLKSDYFWENLTLGQQELYIRLAVDAGKNFHQLATIHIGGSVVPKKHYPLLFQLTEITRQRIGPKRRARILKEIRYVENLNMMKLTGLPISRVSNKIP